MGAHLRDIRVPKCMWRDGLGCSKRATRALYNTRNAEINTYCSQHAPLALQEFKRQVGES